MFFYIKISNNSTKIYNKSQCLREKENFLPGTILRTLETRLLRRITEKVLTAKSGKAK